MNALVAALWLVAVSDASLSDARVWAGQLLSNEDHKELDQYQQTAANYSSLLSKSLANEMYIFQYQVPLAAIAEAKSRLMALEIERLKHNGILRL